MADADDKPVETTDDAKIIDEAVEFLRLQSDIESENRANALADLKFVAGEQWPPELQNSRQLEARPCLTINKLDGFCRQVSNQQRQQRPRIKVHPTNTLATKKIADVITGLCRHIEVNSNADTAYDTAFDLAVKIGFGYWRVVTDFVREDSFDQDIFIQPIDNPFTVYLDGILPDGSDSKRGIISTVMKRAQFKAEYPKADDGSSFTASATGDNADWVNKDEVRIAEFFRVILKPATLCKLSDGSQGWEDQLPQIEQLNAQKLFVIARRPSFRRSVQWHKLTAMEVLETREWPGRWIPIVPVYGNIVVVDGKRKLSGMVRFGKDPQRMVNYWETAATESIALAPKAKWLMAAGQDEGFAPEWAQANQSNRPVLHHHQTDINGQPAPAPQRLQPEPPPVGILQALQTATGNLREVLGVVDPAMRVSGNVSGKALNAEKMQSDTATFHYYDNFTRSLNHTGNIILDLVPTVFDEERASRIIGDDGQPDVIILNGKKTTAEGEVIENNVTVGAYSIVMDTGPGYQSKRIEAVDAMTPLMANEEIMKVIGDLYFRNSDFPGAEVIADRLASINPLAQIDDKSDIPPQVQMKLKQAEQTIKQLQQQLQAAGMEIKTRAGIEQMKDQGQTKRTLITATAHAHDTETWAKQDSEESDRDNATKLHEIEMRRITAESVEEIKGHVALLLARIDERSMHRALNDAEESAVQ